MILSRIFLLIFVVTSAISFSQEKPITSKEVVEEYAFRTKIFGKDEGYDIKNYSSSIVDDYGTLWVAGSIDEPSVNQFNKSFIGLYFFNGTKFQKFPFTDSLKSGTGLKLLPGINGNFRVLIFRETGPLLFTVNPYDLTYKEISQSIVPIEKATYVKQYVFNNEAFIIYNYSKKSLIYKFNKHDQLELVTEFTIDTKDIVYFERIIIFKEYILLNDKHSGIYLLQKKTEQMSKLTSQDLGISLKKEPKIKIFNHYNYRDTNFFKFNLSNNYFYFDEITFKWKQTNSNRFPFITIGNNKLLNDESNLLIFKSNVSNRVLSLDIHLKNNNKFVTNIILGEFINNPKVNSRDFEKEIFVFNQEKLIQISYKRLKVKSFLEKYSIRAMAELPNNKVLVGTESNGTLEVNLETGEEKVFSGLLNGKPFSPTQVRGFVLDSNGTYCNYGSGICFIDKKTNIITPYRYFPVSQLKNRGNSIYYITNGYKLMRFDKKLRKNIPIANTEGINMQDFIFSGDTVYSATFSGLFIYCDGKQELIKPTNSSNQFLCLINHPSLGLLVGTIDGKVLIYNKSTKEFTEFYSDEFNSSIATLLIDNQNNIWINSFKGIIKYELKNKSTTRFGVQEGFTNNEANRLGALKLKNGNLLIGTIKGLNYFSPAELSEIKIDATLKLTGASYISADGGQKLIISPKELNDLKKITLTPQNRSVSISFGFNDIIGFQKNLRYKYRLNKGQWRIVNDFGELYLGNLAPDKYDLEIIVINQIDSEIGSPLNIVIIAKQFFYKTSWFWLLIISLFSFIAIWITSQFIKNQRLKQHFSDKIINAHIEEQASLSQKLHDSVGQKLLLAKNDFILNKKVPKEELSNLDEIISEVRNISHDLHPLQFKELGFNKSVENLVGDFERNSSIYYSHEIDYNKSFFSVEKEIILFGIIQECLNNAEKHSQADACQVKIINKGKNLFIRIKDNGKGFDQNNASKKFSLGLKTMKEKAGYLDASFDIKSKLNEGTKVTLKAKIKH